MLTRLPNGQFAVDTQDAVDGDMIRPVETASEWTDGTYDPKKVEAEQARLAQIKRMKEQKLAKLKREQEKAERMKFQLEDKMAKALAKSEKYQLSDSQKALRDYHLKNQAMGETKSDYGPTYDLEQMSAKSAFNVTPVKGLPYGPQEYFVQDYDYQTSPDHTQFRNRYADNVQFHAPIGMKIKDHVSLYTEGDVMELTERDIAVLQEQRASEFNYTEQDMINDAIQAEETSKQTSKLGVAALIAAIIYMMQG